MAGEFHYPPDVFDLLVNTIPLLCRSKLDVILFLQGSGVYQEDLAEVSRVVKTNRGSISKYEIVRQALTKVNARGDSGLRARREIIKRVTEFERFETCWAEDQQKARGFVASVREAVNAKDSFTRMKQERDTEREERLAGQRAEQAAAAERRANLGDLSNRLSALFGMDDRPQERGILLEGLLNDLFKAYDVQIRESFRRRDPDSSVVLEQIDGVIALDGDIYLVEMKWLKDPVGMAEFSPHLVRLFGRASVRGIFISTSEYTEPVIKECANVLNQRTMFLCSLKEIVMLLQRKDNLLKFLRTKANAAIVEKNPYLEVLS